MNLQRWNLVRPCAVLCWVVFLLSPHVADAEEQPVRDLPDGFQRRTFSDEQGNHPYVVFVPKDYSAEEKWPVVLFLHGAGEKGTDGIRPLSVGLGTALEAHPDKKFLAIFPQCEDLLQRHLTCWLAGSDDGERALRILKQVEQDFSIDPQRRVLSGWSMGGFGAWSLAAAHPELWSGVLTLSGGQTEEPLSLAKLAEYKIPVWAIHGEDDVLIPPDSAMQTVQQLNELGGNGTMTVVQCTGHNVWQYAFADQRVMSFLTRPQSVEPSKISSLTQNEPLPGLSQFYVQHYTQLEILQDLISIRMGNSALAVISQGIPELIPDTALRGQLDDIERRFTANGEQAVVKLTDLQYNGHVINCRLQAISGGRFSVEFQMQPLRLTVGGTSLQIGDEDAKTGEFQIEIGHRTPISFNIEIQPSVDSDGLHLTPIRQQFAIDDGNWFISKPEEIVVHSDTYTKANIVTGIVGGLYLRKSEIESAVLDVIPSLLKVLEEELNSRETPQLARLLWPLPALVPDISIAPGQIRTDPHGLSLVFDIHVRTSKSEQIDSLDQLLLNTGFRVTELSKTEDLKFNVSLKALEALGQLAIRENLAYVNVLDLPFEGFKRFIQPDVLNSIFPDFVDSQSQEKWDVGLRLVEPFQVRSAARSTQPGVAFMNISAPDVRFEVTNRDTGAERVLHFSVRQGLEVDSVEVNGVPKSFEVRWLPNPKIQTHENGRNTSAQGQEFEKIFTEIWTAWSESLSAGEQAIPRLEFGDAALVLKSFEISDSAAEVTFSAIQKSSAVEKKADTE